MPWGAVAAVGGSLLSSAISSGSASSNADEAIGVVDPLKDYQSDLAGNLNSQLTSPDTAATYGALNGVGAQLGNLIANPDSVTQTKQYQNQLNQGLAATNSTLSAQGLNGSGAQTLALNNYGASSANTAYNTQLNQLSQLYGQNLGAMNQQQGNLLNAITSGTGNAGNVLVGAQNTAQNNANSGSSGLGGLLGSLGGLFGGSSTSGISGSNFVGTGGDALGSLDGLSGTFSAI